MEEQEVLFWEDPALDLNIRHYSGSQSDVIKKIKSDILLGGEADPSLFGGAAEGEQAKFSVSAHRDHRGRYRAWLS